MPARSQAGRLCAPSPNCDATGQHHLQPQRRTRGPATNLPDSAFIEVDGAREHRAVSRRRRCAKEDSDEVRRVGSKGERVWRAKILKHVVSWGGWNLPS